MRSAKVTVSSARWRRSLK